MKRRQCTAQIYDNHASLMRFLSDIPMALPKVLSVNVKFVIMLPCGEHEGRALDLVASRPCSDAARRENLNSITPASAIPSLGA